MIIGPNGTGKSTLVCAICLGLGWPPSTLGRAKELGEYVKTGQPAAEIQIELAAGPKQKGRNPVIRRVIKREGNKSSWFINGSSVGHKDILQLTKSFHIQIDNLCQFLPQDRVVEFAAMTPVQLLESTQKAAASEQMTEWHNTLKKLGASRRKRLEEHEGGKRNLSELQARQNAAQADVNRINERNELIARLAILEKCKPGVQYKKELRKYKEIKNGAREAEEVLRQLEAELEPSFREITAKEKYRDQIKQVLQGRKSLVSRFLVNADAIIAKVDTHKSKSEECDNKLQAEGKAAKDRNIQIDKLKKEITQLEDRRKNAPGDFNAAEFNERIREKDGEKREKESKLTDMKESMRTLRADLQLKKRSLDRMEQEQGSLNTQAGQQNEKLRNLSRDSFKAWEWIQENRSLFKDEVYGPPAITCSVKDKRISNAVETALQKGDFTAFTVTSSEDFNTLQRHVYGKGTLNLSDITIRTADKPLSHYRPPISTEELRAYNLDDWLINGLNGPDRVLAMLCDSARLQRTAFSVKSHSDAEFEMLKESPVQQWTAGNQMYTISRRREYGAAAVSTSVRVLKPALIWTDQPIDSGRERELRENLAAINEEISEGKERHNRLQTSMQGLTAEMSSLTEQKVHISVI
jgi:chromosome segregation ATPase